MAVLLFRSVVTSAVRPSGDEPVMQKTENGYAVLLINMTDL